MSQPSVEPAEPDDAPAIEALAREAWHAAYDEILGASTVDTVVDDWYDVEGLRENIDDATQPVGVARRGDSIRGFAHAGPRGDGNGWALYRLYVAPDFWGEGIGTALLRYAEDGVRDRGADAYRLGVLAENDVGVSFYESRGFERVETATVELAGVETTEYTYRKPL